MLLCLPHTPKRWQACFLSSGMCFLVIILDCTRVCSSAIKIDVSTHILGFWGVFLVRVVGLRSCSRTAGRTDCCMIECHNSFVFGVSFWFGSRALRSCSRIAGRTDCCWIECHTFYALWGVFLVRVVGLRSCLRTAGRIGCRWIECF